MFKEAQMQKNQTPTRWKFCGKPGKRTLFKIKKKFEVSIKERKNKRF